METQTKCKICNSYNFRYIGKPRYNDSFPHISERDYKIVQCKHCGYYFIAPDIDLTQEEWQQLYENEYFADSQKTKWQIELNHKELKQRMQLICQTSKIEKGRFLDMGCGEGYMLKEAAKNGFETYGADIADNLAVENKEKHRFFKGSIFDAGFPDDYFSVIFMDSVMEHVPNPLETLAEMKRILKPEGVMLIIVPNEDSTMNAFVKWCYTISFQRIKYGKIKPFVTPYHIQGFNRESLTTLFKIMELEVLTMKSFGGNYSFWRAFKPFTKKYLMSLMSYPVGLISIITGQQIQLLSMVRK